MRLLCLLCKQNAKRYYSSSKGRLQYWRCCSRIWDSKRPEYVPRGYLRQNLTQATLQQLRWLLQKDKLKQDVFLIGAPGTARRALVLQYLELTKREYEYLPLTRDTTEADIKQRREIRQGNAYYVDLCAVRAALNGRVLVLDGIEKAERNVLPILNNLLENREMQLDDGRFLVAPQKYDKLLKDHSSSQLSSWSLERVSEDFHVICLGLPVPKFRGHTLDPPFRSRFQSKNVQPQSFKDHFNELSLLAPNVSSDKLSELVSFVYSLMTEEGESLGLPAFPVDNLHEAVLVWNSNPSLTVEQVIRLLYPYKLMLKTEGQEAVKNALDTFSIRDTKNIIHSGAVKNVRIEDNNAVIGVQWNKNDYEVTSSKGTVSPSSIHPSTEYVPNTLHSRMLASLFTSHSVRDFCIVGPKGCGKTTLVNKFAQMLGYEVDTIMLYQDMTSRDLLQQRRMLPSGDTIWQESQLVSAAKMGHLAVLDGIHRVHHSTLNVLHRLVHERELQLFDGTRLFGEGRYNLLKAQTSLTDEQLMQKNIFPIHPSFRIIGLGEPPNLQEGAQHWLNSELLTMFLFHDLPPLSSMEEATVISKLVPNAPSSSQIKLLEFVQTLRSSTDTNLISIASHLSTRQLLRIMRRMVEYPSSECLHTAIHKASLSRFLPSLAKQSLDSAMKSADIVPLESTDSSSAVRCEVIDDVAYIGEASIPVYKASNTTMVPDILFYDNTEHLRIMEAMLKDWLLGEHLLLIGNQGVGKNKVADRFLQLLNRPRQYIQLHRDTTVQTLTLQSTVIDGVLVYEDSPLVKAVKHGDVLVVDEGDKAPTHVTCVLKSLLESSHMYLADGREIRPPDAEVPLIDEMNVIRMHPDFRVIVLANRPGFPFLGNDFYSALGDLFACHAVDNPSEISELSMLKKYGPDVADQTLNKLIGAFSELRHMADEGLLSYPYSSRELVNIVKHIQNFTSDGLPTVCRNVFDFDTFSKDTQKTLSTVLAKHGIPLDKTPTTTEIKLAPKFPLPDLVELGSWGIPQNEAPVRLEAEVTPLSLNVYEIKPSSFPLDRTDARVEHFAEEMASWQLPLTGANMVSDVLALDSEGSSPRQIVVVTVNPISLFMLDPQRNICSSMDLYQLFPSTRGYFRPRVRIAQMPGNGHVLLHEEMTNQIIDIDLVNNHLNVFSKGSAVRQVLDKVKGMVDGGIDTEKTFNRMLDNFLLTDGRVFFYTKNANIVRMIDFAQPEIQMLSVQLPVKSMIHEAFAVAKDRILVKLVDGSNKLLVLPEGSNGHWSLETVSTPDMSLLSCSSAPMPNPVVQAAVGREIDSPNRLMSSEQHFAALSIGFPDMLSTGEIYAFPRPGESLIRLSQPYWATDQSLAFVNPAVKFVSLEQLGQIVRARPVWNVPAKIKTKELDLTHTAGFLEITDVCQKQVSYISVPSPKFSSHYTGWLCSLMEAQFVMSKMGQGVVTADASGCVRTWETAMTSLEGSMAAWKRMMGVEEQELQINYEKGDADLDKLTEPKFGMVDPGGMPHVGGGMFAGGTGGFNTAGLGGAGGPFRLDMGHPVFQVSDAVKEQVPEHIRQKAREMAQRAYKKKLKEIRMSEFDAELYEKFKGKVDKQVSLLKVIIDNLQAKGKERQWVRHQTSGDLDEGKLIEGLTGEKSIYRRRAAKEPEPGTPMQKPKLLRICVDVSGSMYRFNGYDGRLQRSCESCLMMMEALVGHEDRVKYAIVGHSGDEPDVGFSSMDRPPANQKERLNVLKAMIAHSQFTFSGDHTLEATNLAVKELSKQDADERFVIVLSDANLDRYGIRPEKFKEIMNSDDRVNVFAVFIGSLGEQADRLKRKLPAGKAFVCKDTGELPNILQQIFTSTVLKGDTGDD